jgi:hypothetical protein
MEGKSLSRIVRDMHDLRYLTIFLRKDNWPKRGCIETKNINLLKPNLNPSAQRCLMKFFTGDFAS